MISFSTPQTLRQFYLGPTDQGLLKKDGRIYMGNTTFYRYLEGPNNNTQFELDSNKFDVTLILN